ncbi:hypothetical protein ES695_05290, partial [Candidatus Atribacteria bacterium 1244-E10-H5-B2]
MRKVKDKIKNGGVDKFKMTNNKGCIGYLKGFKMDVCKTVKDDPDWLKYRLDRNNSINEIIGRLNILDEIYKAAKPALDNFFNYGLRESEV